MKVGDLVIHHLDKVPGIIIEFLPCIGIPDPGMVKVHWSKPNLTCRNDNLYRAGFLFLLTNDKASL